MTLDYFYGQSGELFAYFRIPKALFQDSRFRQLSTDARTLYGILLDRMSLSVKNNWLDEQGRVYIIYTVREVQESLCCAEHKAVKLFRELEQTDLISPMPSTALSARFVQTTIRKKNPRRRKKIVTRFFCQSLAAISCGTHSALASARTKPT